MRGVFTRIWRLRDAACKSGLIDRLAGPGYIGVYAKRWFKFPIPQLPQGYQTPIGEHGVGLSGGQKQRIAIARALLKRPKILIFDEATSSLDPSTAEQFAKTVNQLKGKVTMIFIAHQLPKGLHVDSVITLGPHETRMQVVQGDNGEREDG